MYVFSPNNVKSSGLFSNPQSKPNVDNKANLISSEADSLISSHVLDHLNQVLRSSDNVSFPPSYSVEIVGGDSYLIIEVYKR
jgi:hypothetical protein